MHSTKELNARIIGSTLFQSLDHFLVGNPAKGVKSVRDLQGKRVGVLSEKSWDTHLLRNILDHEGVDGAVSTLLAHLSSSHSSTSTLTPPGFAGVTMVPLGSQYGKLAPFVNGEIDAGFMVHSHDPGQRGHPNRSMLTPLGFRWTRCSLWRRS